MGPLFIGFVERLDQFAQNRFGGDVLDRELLERDFEPQTQQHRPPVPGTVCAFVGNTSVGSPTPTPYILPYVPRDARRLFPFLGVEPASTSSAVAHVRPWTMQSCRRRHFVKELILSVYWSVSPLTR